jgi:hypothetical protein
MEKSESIKELATALAKAQAELPSAKFDAENPHLHNHYATLGSMIEATRKTLSDNGLSITQFLSGEGDRIGVTTMLMHSSGEWIRDTVYLSLAESKGLNLAQVAGSISSYFRRYGWAAAIGAYAEADDDGDGAPAQRSPVERIKEGVKQAAADYETAHTPQPAQSDFVLAWKKAKELTGLERPTLSQIYVSGPQGIAYLEYVLNKMPDPDDPKMKETVDRAKKAIGTFLGTFKKVEPAGPPPVGEPGDFKILTKAWTSFAQRVATEIPYYQDKATNGPSTFHIIGALKKMNYWTVSDENLEELYSMLRLHAIEREEEEAKKKAGV